MYKLSRLEAKDPKALVSQKSKKTAERRSVSKGKMVGMKRDSQRKKDFNARGEKWLKSCLMKNLLKNQF